jgi:hypothetical protein
MNLSLPQSEFRMDNRLILKDYQSQPPVASSFEKDNRQTLKVSQLPAAFYNDHIFN